ncbi:hypothetical protein NVV94_05675 [Pseudomonas sp. LS1212]|uniref:hypothetical protein n=1 Tax=Pseudomonas sp. LS1212 TaxID=2972478 RepID=UPI00215B9D9E|nr:hypothetical protein [Pseudomonas sp. LS1212]UVJ45071.1 hypothetical protein NVV94_05675 [Pseudomonas sp. LS1212]
MNSELINRHVQACAIQFISYSGTMRALAGYVQHSMGDNAPSIEELTRYLQRPETHKELLKYEVGLWRDTLGNWCLVSLATPPTLEGMRYRLEHFPVSNTCCRWCLLDSKRLAHIDLIYEKDIRNEPVPRSLLHKICMKPWLSMRTQVARSGVTTS